MRIQYLVWKFYNPLNLWFIIYFVSLFGIETIFVKTWYVELIFENIMFKFYCFKNIKKESNC